VPANWRKIPTGRPNLTEESAALEPFAEDWDRALAIVAHPDDMEYGSASAVGRWTSQGKEVTYLLVTRGEAGISTMAPEETAVIREREERESAAVVGVSAVEFLDHKDGVIEYGLALRRDVARAVRRYRPEILVSLNPRETWGYHAWNMADHRAVGFAAIDGARDAGNRWVFPELSEEGLEPWGGVRMVCFNGSPDPTHGVDVTDFMDMGVESLRKHKAYIEALGSDFDVETFLKNGAEATGKRLGCKYAVAFEVYRV
jgi:LmbE family N-acetylglucosaminyl deacetylase